MQLWLIAKNRELIINEDFYNILFKQNQYKYLILSISKFFKINYIKIIILEYNYITRIKKKLIKFNIY